MKLVFIALSIFCCGVSYAQKLIKTTKVVSVLPETRFRLTSKIALSQEYRYGLKIRLPQNTVEWYYVFNASDDDATLQTIDLIGKLSGLATKGIGSLAVESVVSALNLRQNTGRCNVYLFGEREQLEAFMNKNERFRYYLDYSRENLSSGIVKIGMDGFLNDKTEFFIGVENRKMTLPVYATIEVAAIVQEDSICYLNWSDKLLDSLHQKIKQDLLRQDYDDEKSIEIAHCVVESLTTKLSPKDWEKYSETKKQRVINETKASCLGDNQNKPDYQKAMGLLKIAWISYQSGEIDKAIESTEKALAIDASLGEAKSNLGLFYLIKGDESKAMELYVEAVTNFKQEGKARKGISDAIAKLNAEAKKNSNLVGWKKIEEYLQRELNRFEKKNVQDESPKLPPFMREKKQPKTSFPFKKTE